MAKQQSKHGRAQRVFPAGKSIRRGAASGSGPDTLEHRVAGNRAELAAGWSLFGIPSGEIKAPRGLGALELAYLVASARSSRLASKNCRVIPVIGDAQLHDRPPHDFSGGGAIFRGGVANIHWQIVYRTLSADNADFRFRI